MGNPAVPVSTHILCNFANPSSGACDCDLDRATDWVMDKDVDLSEAAEVARKEVGAVPTAGTGRSAHGTPTAASSASAAVMMECGISPASTEV